MVALFENSYKLTDDMQLEIIRNISHRQLLFAYGAFSVTGAVLTVLALLPPAELTQALLPAACTAALVFSFFNLPERNLRILKNLRGGTFNENNSEVTLLFGEHISVLHCGNSTKYEYTDIKTIYILGDLIVLSFDKFNNYAVPKESFTKGEFSQWKEFIAGQCEDTACKKKKNFIVPTFINLSEEEFLND